MSSSSDIHSIWNTDQVYHDLGTPGAPANITNPQTPIVPGLWNPSGMQPLLDVLSLSSMAVNKGPSNYASPAPYSAYNLGQNDIHHDSFVPFDPNTALQSVPSDQWPLPPLVHVEATTRGFLDQSSAYSSHVGAPHTHYSQYPFPGLPTPHYPPPRQVCNSTSPHFTPYTTSAGFHDTDPRPHPTSRRALHGNSTGLTRHSRAVSAVEYRGLWIDEEELFKFQTELDGKLIVHKCHWEKDRSPCHLWITGDKSCINAHIQKWHGGKPGGDKSHVQCHWSACGKTMLKESIARHILTIHLNESWECCGCGKRIARDDVYSRHAARSDIDACRTSGALVTYSPGAQEIDARAAFESKRSRQYAHG